MNDDSLSTYALSRENLQAEITQKLSADPRFVAAWLTGSVGRGEADEVSDLDVTVVVGDAYCEVMCARPWEVSSRTTPERLALFSWFGQPVVIHENNHNAPQDGSFTFVLYDKSALMVDWIVRPQVTAQRSAQSRVLFDHVGISLLLSNSSPTLAQRQEMISERIAFFWMMVAVTCKYAIRRDGVFVQCWLENLAGVLREVEQLLVGQVAAYQRGSLTWADATSKGQLQAIRFLSERMLVLMREAEMLGAQVSVSPMVAIERLLGMAPADPKAL